MKLNDLAKVLIMLGLFIGVLALIVAFPLTAIAIILFLLLFK